MNENKIFEGCKHPELIDQYIQGVKDGAAKEWISVEERLPGEDGAYLCADSSDDIYVAYRFPSLYGPKAYFNGMIDDKPKYPTHWQHLPEPPSDEK